MRTSETGKIGSALALGAAVLIVVASLGQPAATASRSLSEQEMRDAVEGLLQGSMSPAEAHESCLLSLKLSGKAGNYREVMSAFLDVPGNEALPALCRAVVQGIAGGAITAEQLQPALNPTHEDEEAVAFGELLRAIYFSHRATAAPAGVAQ